jgi:hypothetical protein
LIDWIPVRPLEGVILGFSATEAICVDSHNKLADGDLLALTGEGLPGYGCAAAEAN